MSLDTVILHMCHKAALSVSKLIVTTTIIVFYKSYFICTNTNNVLKQGFRGFRSSGM
jgi:hypothetical protein